jgi:hypothetical protein
MGIQQIGGEGADWIVSFQDEDQWVELVMAVLNLRVP